MEDFVPKSNGFILLKMIGVRTQGKIEIMEWKLWDSDPKKKPNQMDIKAEEREHRKPYAKPKWSITDKTSRMGKTGYGRDTWNGKMLEMEEMLVGTYGIQYCL